MSPARAALHRLVMGETKYDRRILISLVVAAGYVAFVVVMRVA
jgi:hypothetical protein